MKMRSVLPLLSALVVTVVAAPTAVAVPQFQKEFLKLYIEEHEDAQYKEFVVKKAKCNACHQGKKRKNLNPYGQQLGKLLDRKKDMKNAEKIVEALGKVGEMHFDPKDEKSPTFEERITASKLPGGELEDLLKEPEAEEGE